MGRELSRTDLAINPTRDTTLGDQNRRSSRQKPELESGFTGATRKIAVVFREVISREIVVEDQISVERR